MYYKEDLVEALPRLQTSQKTYQCPTIIVSEIDTHGYKALCFTLR